MKLLLIEYTLLILVWEILVILKVKNNSLLEIYMCIYITNKNNYLKYRTLLTIYFTTI